MRRTLLIVVIVLVFALAASIAYYNSQPITLNYLAGTIDVPLIALIGGELLIVALLTLLMTAGRVIALKSELRQARKQLRDTENELKNLRNIPLKDV